MSLEIQNKIDKEKYSINVHIRSRSKNYYKGPVKSLTSINETGEFDVLPQHANFVTLIKDFIIIDKGFETEQKFDIDTGVLSVLGDSIDAYIGV